MKIAPKDRVRLLQLAIKNGMQLGVVDIETSHMLVKTFAIGRKININHSQVIKPTQVISIQYLLNNDKKAKYLEWTTLENGEHDDSSMLEDFATNILPNMDVVVTQNGDSFDFKILNDRLMTQKLTNLVQKPSLDILKTSKASFRGVSHKLDYRSKIHGKGGKISMTEQDWFDVEDNILPVSAKMGPYGCKDVEDTRDVLFEELPYYKRLPLLVENVILEFSEARPVCQKCQDSKKRKFDTVKKGRGLSVSWECLNCGNEWK